MGKVLGFCHEEGVEAIYGFEFEMEILILLHSRF